MTLLAAAGRVVLLDPMTRVPLLLVVATGSGGQAEAAA